MAFISSSIPNLVNGISQQPDSLRLPSQAERQVNGYSSTASGLRKRPETEFIKNLFSATLSNADQVFVHFIERDEDEKYIVVVSGSNLRVFDLAGVEQTVNFPDGKSYLSTLTPAKDMRLLTVADTTFVVNRTVTTEKGTIRTPRRPYEGIVSVQAGNYGKTYEILINGVVVASYSTPDGTAGAHAAQIGTDFIAEQLFNDLEAAPSLPAGVDLSADVSYRHYFYKDTSNRNAYHATAILVPAEVATEDLRVQVGTFFQVELSDSPVEPLNKSAAEARSRIFLISSLLNVVSNAYSLAYLQSTSNVVVENGTYGAFDPFAPPVGYKVVWYVPPYAAPSKITDAGLATVIDISPTYDVDGNLVDTAFKFALSGSTIYISCGANFSLQAKDDFNNNAMQAYKDNVQSFIELPANGGVEGFTIKIVGDNNQKEDDYYIRWTPFDKSPTQGVWRECAEPNTIVSVNRETMPHVLVREADNTFTFRVAEYSNRLTGDEDSNPFPSFIDKQIADVTFYKNRLCFVAKEQVVFSEAGEFYNFFRTSVRDLLDSDPVDVTVSHVRVSDIQYAIPFNKDLILMSSQSQFLISGDELLTAKSISVKTISDFAVALDCIPKPLNKNIYVPTKSAGFSKLGEYYLDADEVADMGDATAHVPEYLPLEPRFLATCEAEDLVVFNSNLQPSKLYAYKFYWQGQEKLQASWSEWDFGENDYTILGCYFYDTDMYLVGYRGNRITLDRAFIEETKRNVNEPYRVYLDRKTTNVGIEDILDDCVITMPYDIDARDQYWAVIAEGQEDAGAFIPLKYAGSFSLLAENQNFEGVELIVGKGYEFLYEFSTLYLRQNNKVDELARLQLRNMTVNFSDTAYFSAEVTPEGRDTYTYVYSGKTLGTTSATIGTVTFSDGQFRFPINTKNLRTSIVVKNDKPVNCLLTSADWEALFVKRTRGA